MKKVLITGVASGIGSATKEIFLNNGFEVFGIDIKETKDTNNFKFFKADITNDNELKDIQNYFNENNIIVDAIINIAGIHKMASLVENSYQDLKKVININLIGPMMVNNLFHKYLKLDGKIIIITSEVAILDPLPFNGLYSVSKIALENYAQALRQELNLIGQKVITILPGAIETPLQSGSLDDTHHLSQTTQLYKKEATKFVKITKKFMGTPLKPIKLAKLIYKVTNKKRLKIRYKIHHNIGLVLLNILPKRLQCYIIKKIL